MKTLFLLTSNCLLDAGANGLCARNLEDALRAIGFRVVLVGYTSNEKDAVNGATQKVFWYQRKSSSNKGFLHKSAMIAHSIAKPIYDEELVEKYFYITDSCLLQAYTP